MSASDKKTAVIVVGEAGCTLGAALAQRFAAEARRVVLAASETGDLEPIAAAICQAGGEAHTHCIDPCSETALTALFDSAASNLEVAAYTACGGWALLEPSTDPTLLEHVWQRSVYSAFLTGKAAAQAMLRQKHGTLLFTGVAAAPIKPPYSPFVIAKAGLREMAREMAREFAPHGIHVVDAVQDAHTPNHGEVCPSVLADRCWQAHCEPVSAWNHEVRL